MLYINALTAIVSAHKGSTRIICSAIITLIVVSNLFYALVSWLYYMRCASSMWRFMWASTDVVCIRYQYAMNFNRKLAAFVFNKAGCLALGMLTVGVDASFVSMVCPE